MVPPPATPNPHRFASSQQPKPKAPLRPQPYSTSQSASSRQFASTPRFSFRSTQRTHDIDSITADAAQHSSSPLNPRQPPRFPARSPAPRRKDEIQDAGSDDEDRDLKSRATSYRHGKRQEIIEDLPSSPSHTTPQPHNKRRRLDTITISSSLLPSPPPTSSSPHQLHTSPQTHPSSPPPPQPSTHNQPFILSPKRPSSTPGIPASTNRPTFVLPPRSPSPPPTTLHPIFSPHRRGGPKFLPGGMAATVRDWVLDIAATTPGTKEGEWDIRFRCGETRAGERVTLVEEAAETRRWMLVGNSAGEAVRRGMMVGIKRPAWDVEVAGEMWGIGVDWAVLDG